MYSRYVVGNWKMNLGPAKASSFLDALLPTIGTPSRTQVWITPPLCSAAIVAARTKDLPIKVGAQNVHWADSGAFTGEIAPVMCKELGLSYALVGHSERRHIFGETDDLCAKRAVGAAASGLSVIFCVGERLEEREGGKTLDVVRKQLLPLKGALSAENQRGVLIAYEPVWAIGTGKVATPVEIEDTCKGVAALWTELLGSSAPPVLYGGSVDPQNIDQILACPAVQGCLVGGASIVPEKFAAIIKAAER